MLFTEATAPPSDLTADVVGSSVGLSWVLNSLFEQNVLVYRGPSAVGPWTTIATLPRGTTEYVDGELQAGKYFHAVATRLRVIASTLSNITESDVGEVIPAPFAAFEANATTAVAGSTISFTDASTGVITTHENYVDDVLISTTANFSHEFASAGTYDVKKIVTGPGGSDTEEKIGYITINAPVAPFFVSAVVAANGTTLTVTYNQAVTGHVGHVFVADGEFTGPPTYVSGEGTTSLVYTLFNTTVYAGQTCLISYASAGGDINHLGTEVQDYTAFAVTNNSEQNENPPEVDAPEIVSMTVNAAGNQLSILHDEVVTGTTGYTITPSGGSASLTYLSGTGTATLVYSINRTILDPETLTGAYTPGNVVDGSGNPLLPASGVTVTNNSAATASAPGAPTGFEAIAAGDNSIVLAWELADANDTSVTVQRSASGAETWGTIATLAGGTLQVNDTGPLSAGTTFDYRVRASSPAGDSAWATVSCATAADGSNAALALAAFSVANSNCFKNVISFTAPASTMTSKVVAIYSSSDGGLTYQRLGIPSVATGTAYTVDHAPLAPGTTYLYKARCFTPSSIGPFSSSSAATGSQGSLPSVPTGLGKIELTTTSAVLSWIDTNGGTIPYEVWTAPIPGFGSFGAATWTRRAETAAGATSYGLTTAARMPLFWRIRAKSGSDYSEYVYGSTVRPPSGDTPSTITIGAGGDYPTINAAAQTAINALGKGSTVTIDGTHTTPFMASCRGTPAEPITFIGINGATIDGLSGVMPSTATMQGGTTFWGLGALVIHRLSSDTIGHTAGWLNIENIKFTRASGNNSPTNTFTDPAGASRAWNVAAAGIYIAGGDNITIDGCEIAENGNGIFAAANGEIRQVRNLTIRGNYIHGNGQASSAQRHQTYIEAEDVIYEYNWYGQIRETSGAFQLKDRSTNCIIRYNYIENAGGRQLDLVEGQNNFGSAWVNPAYHITHCYGNKIETNTSSPIHYGGDSANDAYYRHGQLRFYHNTLIANPASSPTYRVRVHYANSLHGVLESRNNVYYVKSTISQLALFFSNYGTTDYCSGVFTNNFIRADWARTAGTNTFAGLDSGTGTFITNAGNLPDFVAIGTNDAVLGGTTSANAGGRIPSDWLPVLRQYVHPQSSTTRAAYGTGSDLGAYTASPDVVPSTVVSAAIDVFGGTYTIVYSERTTSTGTGHTLSSTGGAVTATYVSGSGTVTHVFNLSRVVVASETVTRSYAAGDTADLASNALADYSAQPVTNNSSETSTTGSGVRSVSTYDSVTAVTTAPIPKPTGLENGDVVVAAIHVLGSATVTPPAGFTITSGSPRTDGWGSTRVSVYTHVVTDAGSEPATYDFGIGSQRCGGFAVRVALMDTADLVNAVAAGVGSTSSSATAQTSPAVTTDEDNCYIMRVGIIDRTYTVTKPALHIEKVNLSETLLYGGKLFLAVATQATAGSTGTADFTLSTARAAGFITLALNSV